MPSKNILTALIFLAVCGLGVFGFSGEAQAERFYHTTNTWDVKIPSGHPTTSESVDYIADIKDHSTALAASYRAIPVYYAEPNTQNITVGISPYLEYTNPGLTQYIEDNHWNEVPIPNGAVPAYNDNNCDTDQPNITLHDGYMVVISVDRNWAWQFHSAGHCNGPLQGWQNGEANPNDASSGRWDAYFVRKMDLRGDGLLLSNPTQQNPYGTYDMLGAPRAGAADHLHGLVTYDEVAAGEINHAMAYAYSSSEEGQGVYPSVIGTGVTPCSSATPNRNCLRLGMRLQLDPTLDITNLGLNRTGLIVAKALQEYGMIFVINNGINTYTGKGYQNVEFESLENPLTSGKSWKGPDSPLDFPLPNLDKIPTNRFRVVEPVYPPFGEVVVPSITSPAPNTTLSGSSQEFTWNTSGIAVTAWYLWAGPCDSAALNSCGDDYYNSGLSTGTTLTKTATNLPVDGSTVHIRLWYKVGTAWQSELFTYTAHTAAVEKKNYYIATAAEGGSDSNPCSLNSPCATIKYASEKLVAGDTLYIREGTYYQGMSQKENTFYAGPAGTSANPITIRNYPGETVIFDGQKEVDGNEKGVVWIWEYFYTVNHRHLIIDGLTFKRYLGGTMNINEQAANITVQNCIFKEIKTELLGQNYGHGIYIASYYYTPENITIRNNYFNTPSGIGIQFNHAEHTPMSGKNVDIYNNVFDSSLRGIHLAWYPTNINIYNNTFYKNEIDIRVSFVTNVVIKNNLSYTSTYTLGTNTATGRFLVVDGAGINEVTINNNLVHHVGTNTGSDRPIRWNTTDGDGGTYYTLAEFRDDPFHNHEVNGISDYPSLVDPDNDDFTIPTGSPAKNAGATITLVTTDKIGTARPQGGLYDIGAYEYGNPADVTGDTHVNIKDIQACIKVITNSQTDTDIIAKCNALAEPTGNTNIKDIQVIIRAIIGG